MRKKYDRIYLIDCENIGFSFYSSPNDLVFYFTNSSVKELPFACNENEIHMCLNHNGCKDALDFILDTYLGYLAGILGNSITEMKASCSLQRLYHKNSNIYLYFF